MSEELKPCFTEREMFLIRESFRSGTFYEENTDVRVWLDEQVADNGGTVEQLFAYESGEITASDVPESVRREIQAEAIRELESKIEHVEASVSDWSDGYTQAIGDIKSGMIEEAIRIEKGIK